MIQGAGLNVLRLFFVPFAIGALCADKFSGPKFCTFFHVVKKLSLSLWNLSAFFWIFLATFA